MSQKTEEELIASKLPFGARATAALGVSVVADVLDYAGAPIFALPIVGDIADAIVMTILYRLTGSKTSAAINAIEFIPFIGDMIPTYTLSTLIWILQETRKRNSNRLQLIARDQRMTKRNSQIDNAKIINVMNKDPLETKIRRAYLIARSRIR